MKIAHSERLLKAARDVVNYCGDGERVGYVEIPEPMLDTLEIVILEIDRDQRDGQP